MKLYGVLNDRDEGDILANCVNATKTSNVGTGHSCLRSTKQKRRIRTQMNKSKRAKLKAQLLKELRQDFIK